jgi:hypothetical protein
MVGNEKFFDLPTHEGPMLRCEDFLTLSFFSTDLSNWYPQGHPDFAVTEATEYSRRRWNGSGSDTFDHSPDTIRLFRKGQGSVQ